jgi:hypothetical protein
VELVHVYSNLAVSGLALVELRAQAAAIHRPAVQARARQVQRRLSPKQISELLTAYRQGAPATVLAARFHIHRTTVAAITRRHGMEHWRCG